MKIPLDSVVPSKPSSDSCHISGAGQCACVYKTFAAHENNAGEEKNISIHIMLLSSLYLFASL